MADNFESKPKTEARKAPDVREPDAPGGRIEGGGRSMTENSTRATDAAVTGRGVHTLADAAKRAADQDQERVRAGMRMMAETAAGLADANSALEATARISGLYRRTMEDTTEDMQALMACCANVGQGIQQMQQAWFEVLRRSLEQGRRQPQDLLRCRSPEEFAQVQRDLYLDGVAVMLDSSMAMLRATGEMVNKAMKPLEGRARAGMRG